MEEKQAATLSRDSAVNNEKESQLNTGNNSPESQEVQAADDTGALWSGEGSGSGATSKTNVNEKKRGKGRPRKFENGVPYIPGSMEALPKPTASTSSTKRARGRPKGTGKWQALASCDGYIDTAAGSFTPHVLFVNAGEDLADKIISFCLWVSRSVCVLAATGVLSGASLSISSIGTVTYEGQFEILTLTGSVEPGGVGTHLKNGQFSVSLAQSDGRVFGGSVVGPLIAAGPGPIQLVVASFKENIGRGIRNKYAAGISTSTNVLASSEMVNVPIQVAIMADGKEDCADPNSTPAPVNVRADPVKAHSAISDNVVAENHNFDSTSLEIVGPNNMQKENVIAENHDFISPQSFGPNNLQTSPVALPISDEMITPGSNASFPEMQVKE
ncbi:hypothetical protein DITRI_Ditri05aG0050900 [Diplodiscus trichospermus]